MVSQTVGQLADKLDEAPGGISYHLSQLADAGMAERAGQENGDRRKKAGGRPLPHQRWFPPLILSTLIMKREALPKICGNQL